MQNLVDTLRFLQILTDPYRSAYALVSGKPLPPKILWHLHSFLLEK
jgi:hypothetical protein